MVAQYARAEQEMNAVERLDAYTQLPSEAAGITKNDPDSTWPENGAVSFKNVSLAYRPGLPYVLQDVSFEIAPGQKVRFAHASPYHLHTNKPIRLL